MTTLYDSYTGLSPWQQGGFSWMNSTAVLNYQAWTPSIGYTCDYVKLALYPIGSPTGTLTARLKACDGNHKPTGSTLASASIDASTVISGYSPPNYYTFTWSTGYSLDSGTEYCVTLESDGNTASDYATMVTDNTVPPGYGGSSTNSGSTWDATSNYNSPYEIYGTPLRPVDKIYSKNLVAMGNHEVWYEVSAGTMTELTAANADINTGNPLTAFEAYQKLCIANKTNLKIADFANSKIATDDIGTNAPIKGTILTGGTSGATMIVDYITASSSACTLYGTRTSTTTFSSGETVTGTNASTYNFGGTVPYGSAVSFTTNAAEVAAPHWYDWTPYANDTTNFGSMPTSAYIACLYRGRAVLAGHPNYPHQWYMSKVGEIFNWVYGSTDPLTAVAGNNTDAGEIGDIIRALVPYGDDYLVFGCASSIHILTGDPAFSGQIDEIDNTTGIFSPWSWCRDDSGNLYFWGTNGVYVMESGRSRPSNISEGYLPKLVDDWAVNADTHRVLFTYDPLNHGIIISRTTVDGGANLNYFFDLKTRGFYPETYPTACAFFSGLYHDSDTPANRGLLLGCNDGYIRKHIRTAKDDDTGATDTAISSYFTLEMLDLNEKADNNAGKLTSLTFELGGGASSGTFSDSDGCSFDIHVADDAETCLEDIKDGATPIHTGTLTGTGRTRVRTRIRGKWLGIKFYNSTASQTFVVNSVSADIRPAGNI